jgi:hypothetical protein
MDDIDISLGDSLILLKNELKRIEKKIIIMKLANTHQEECDIYKDIYEEGIPRLEDKYDSINYAIFNVERKINGIESDDEDENIEDVKDVEGDEGVDEGVVEDVEGVEGEDEDEDEGEDDENSDPTKKMREFSIFRAFFPFGF